MNIQDFKSFLEKNLSLADLEKTSKGGGLRGDILINKIKNEEPMKLTSGDDVVVQTDIDKLTDDKQKYSPKKAKKFLLKPNTNRYDQRFVDEDGKTYKLSDFVKIGEFSDNERGTSLGTKDTRIVESIQTLVFAYKQSMIKDGNYKYLSSNIFEEEDILDKLMEFKDITAFISDVEINDIERFSGWYDTFIKTANAFIHQGKISVLSNRIYYNFYQISHKVDFIQALTNAYNRCCRKTMGLGLKQGRTINMAKWSPSDIWAINRSKESEIVKKLNNPTLISDINDLNDYIDDLFDTKNLVGLSLKKLPENHNAFPIIINKEYPRPKYTIDNFVFSRNPFTKNIKIVLNRNLKQYSGKDSLTIRNFTSGLSNIGIEVDGISSRQGKLTSLDTINRYLESKKYPLIPEAKTLDSRFTKEHLINKVFSLDQKLKSKDRTDRKGKEKDKEFGNTVSKEALICKYQCLLLVQFLIECLLKGGYGKTKANSIINSMMYYALSIENDYFKCPKYARVIDY